MDLMGRVRGGVIVARWAFRLCGPIGRLVTMSRFASMVSTAAIKTVGGPLCSPPPPPSFIIAIVLPRHTHAHALALFLRPAFR
jgi:hypothetical protein